MTGAAIDQITAGPPTAATFARGNVALYIDAVYDGHFDAALIGKSLLKGYRKLGGAPAFGATLTEAEVEALARAYSPATEQLHPHPGVQTSGHRTAGHNPLVPPGANDHADRRPAPRPNRLRRPGRVAPVGERSASHARGRRFETRRAHAKIAWKQASFTHRRLEPGLERCAERRGRAYFTSRPVDYSVEPRAPLGRQCHLQPTTCRETAPDCLTDAEIGLLRPSTAAALSDDPLLHVDEPVCRRSSSFSYS